MNASKRIPSRVLLTLAVGIIALSQSPNLIRISNAHPGAIAAWRLLIAGLLFLPLAGQKLKQVLHLSIWKKGALLLSGLALFLHFFVWIAAVQNTTVANATIVIAINPVFTALGGFLLFGEQLTRKLIVAIVLGVTGVTIIGWSDLAFDADHLKGDGLALLASILFTFYLLLGKKLRDQLDTSTYVSVIYLVAAAFGFAFLVIQDLPITNYTERDWLCFGLMALIPTMLGHTSLNFALAHMDAGRVSMAVLVEPLLAGIVAYIAWGEPLGGLSLIGYGVISTSVVVQSLEFRPSSRQIRKDFQ